MYTKEEEGDTLIMHFLLCRFLCVGLIYQICESFADLPEHHGTLHTRASWRSPLL